MISRHLTSEAEGGEKKYEIFDVGVALIFARELFEACIIISNYRTVLKKHPSWQDPEKQKEGLKAITQAALIAAAVALLLCLCIIIPLAVSGKEFDGKAAEIIEGISKVIASICILQLSLKIPKWLGYYTSNKQKDLDVDLDVKSVRFNVAWNIWREVAECGVFLIPYFLKKGAAKSIPVSAVVGIAIALVLGVLIHVGNNKLKNKFWLCFFMAGLMGQLAVGLFTGGCHEFEEVWGMTPNLWKIPGDFWSHKKFPMGLLKPFGYSASRSVLQVCCFWSGMVIMIGLHYWKYTTSQKIFAERAEAGEDIEQGGKQIAGTGHIDDSSSSNEGDHVTKAVTE